MSKPNTDPRIVFLDLETTGLDPNRDEILEIGIVLISRRLRDVPGGDFSRLVKANVGALSIDQDVRAMHTKNGLFDDCAKSGISLFAAEEAAQAFLDVHDFDEQDRIVIGGFTPSFDAGFLRGHMPRLAQRLSHRTFDVSTLRDLVARLIGRDKARAWTEEIHRPFDGAQIHRALLDCHAAIRELRAYAKCFNVDVADCLRRGANA